MLGANAYVPKPFTPDQLRETCGRLLKAGMNPPLGLDKPGAVKPGAP